MTPFHLLFSLIAFSAAISVTIHAILKRRNHHAAVWWICVSWIFPIGGAIFYWFFGINRIERRAARLRRYNPPRITSPHLILSSAIDANGISEDMKHLLSLVRVVENITQLPLTRGNRITPLFNGDQAFPAMLKAIDNAKTSVGLSTYIFDNDTVGERFIESLTRAVERGVQVRVLIDDVGSGFRWKSVHTQLTAKGVPVSYFMVTFVPWRMAYMNLRDHRKILTVDGRIAFSGGMNITSAHQMNPRPPEPAEDVHFQIEGPVVTQIQETFRFDWHFAEGEELSGEAWFPTLPESGVTFSRAIADGPDKDFEKTKLTILGALASAKRSVRVVTPYLLPDVALISALNLCAMEGIQVDVVLPNHSDRAIVNWATQATLWQLLQRGVRVWKTPAPFNHSKLLVIDGGWTLFGSSNWDRRSLRLNFEFNLECYGRELASQIEAHIDARIATAHRITLAEMDARSLPIRLRDGVARLFTPLL